MDDERGIFGGQTFYLLGTISGYTQSKVAKVIEEQGGTVSEDYAQLEVSRIIVSPVIWGQEGTVGASLVLKHVRAANLANAEASVEAERDPDEHRVWLLSFDWVLDSVRAGMMLDDEDFDWEKQKDAMRAKKAKEAADERKRNGGFSKYRPGERARKMKEQEEKAEIREMEREVAREKQDAEKKLRLEKKAKEKEDARRAANPQAAVIVPEMPPMPEPLDLSALPPVNNTTTASSSSYQPYSQGHRALPPLYHRASAQPTSTSTTQAKTKLHGRKFVGQRTHPRKSSIPISSGSTPSQRATASGIGNNFKPSSNAVDAPAKPTASNAYDAAKKPSLSKTFKPVDATKAREGSEWGGTTWRSKHVPAKPKSSPSVPAKPSSSTQVPAKPNSSTQVSAQSKERSSTMPSVVLSDTSDSDVPIARKTSSTSSTVPLKRKLSLPKSSSSEYLVISDSDDGPTSEKART